MATQIDLEKGHQVRDSVAETLSPSSPSSSSGLKLYQALIGNIDESPTAQNKHTVYHSTIISEHISKRWIILSSLTFIFCIAAQIILCLGIAVGAQVGFSKDAISILAAVNTVVAASIAALKGLGLPEKKQLERNKLKKLADRIRFTTRKLKAGMSMDVVAEAEEIRKLETEIEDDAHIIIQVGEPGPILQKSHEGAS